MPMSSLAVWRRRRFPSLFAAFSLVAVVAACDSSTGADGDIAVVAVNPAAPTMNVGATQQLVATPTTSGGRIVDRNVSWSTSNAAVATVDGSGLVTAVAGGSADITATAGGESGTATVTVWFPVQTITLAPAGGVTTIKQEATVQLNPTFIDATGATVTGRQLEWSVDNAAVARVSTSGRVTGLTDGVVRVTATALNGVSGFFDITVNGAPDVATVTLAPTLGLFMAPGMTDQFVATAAAASGTVLSLAGRTVVWTSSTAAVATVSASGLVTMVTEGESDIRVSVDGINSNIRTVEGFPAATLGGAINATGTIASGASKFYVIDVPAGTTAMAITLGNEASAGADLDIFLYSPLGAFLAQSAASGSSEAINRASPAAGRYLLEVNAWDGAGGATGAELRITLTP